MTTSNFCPNIGDMIHFGDTDQIYLVLDIREYDLARHRQALLFSFAFNAIHWTDMTRAELYSGLD
jgi:hypothetical protein